MADLDQLWMKCSHGLRAHVSEATWSTWFEEVRPVGLTDDLLELSVPNPMVKQRLESTYKLLLDEAIVEASGAPRRVDIVVRPHEAHDVMVDAFPEPPDPTGPESLTAARPSPRPGAMPQDGGAFNPTYSFENFVIGGSNRFAHAAALSVAETPARSYNPLFIYGGAGLGKTHLLHAIGNYIHLHYPSLRTRYVSTESFMNEFVDAIRNNTGTDFKRHYRECDILLVDDIQFIEGKESLQEEFFHTFNSLHGANRQIVISSDRGPDAIATLEDRLRTRFKWGLITDVQPPELETRLAILHRKAERDGDEVPEPVFTFIAERITENIRELEGALIRANAWASLNREPLTVDLAERALADILVDADARVITPDVILEATSTTFGFSVEELMGRSRRRPLVTARQIGMYVLRELTDLSYPAIAREFGGRDHTTVIHAVDKIKKLMGERRAIYEQVTTLIQEIKHGG